MLGLFVVLFSISGNFCVLFFVFGYVNVRLFQMKLKQIKI